MGYLATRRIAGALSSILFVFVLVACTGFYRYPPGYDRPGPSARASTVLQHAAYRASGVAHRAPADDADRTETAPWPRSGTILVRSGDTMYGLARRYDVSLDALARLNDLGPPYVLATGQRLVLPRPRSHVVRSGDTLYGIARRYDVAMRALARRNALAPPYRIIVGQALALPTADGDGDVGTMVARLPAPDSRAKMPPSAAPILVSAVPMPADPRPHRGTGRPPPRSGEAFLWPVRGAVLVGFGDLGKGLFNDGINIASEPGTPVLAAENGVVVYAGNEIRGFGNLILLKHADGWTSAYAHNAALLVEAGDRVRRGDAIARVGSTGSVARPQLHFELRKGEAAVDPEKYLAAPMAGAEPVSRVFARAGRQDPG